MGQPFSGLAETFNSNGITSMEQLYEKVSAMNDAYYDLRGKIVKTERRLAVLDKRLEMWAQYENLGRDFLAGFFQPFEKISSSIKSG